MFQPISERIPENRSRSVLESTKEDLVQRLLASSPEQQQALLETYLWQQLAQALEMDVEEVAQSTDIRDLGIDSLIIMNVMNSCKRDLQMGLKAEPFYELTTFPLLADYLANEFQRTHSSSGPALASESALITPSPLRPQQRQTVAPLSFAQQRFWLFNQLEPDSALYTIPLALCLDGALRLDILEQSLREIVQRHESLRTLFKLHESTPVQLIATSSTPVFQVIDLQMLLADARDQVAEELSRQEVQQPFDLGSGPLVRIKLFILNPTEHLFLFTTHHIVMDGLSRGILLRELETLYTAFVKGNPSPLPALDIQYADYAIWQRRYVQGELLELQIAYWKQQLSGAVPLLDLPTVQSRPAIQTYQGAHLPIQIPSELLQEVKALSQRESVTVFVVLLAAFKVLLLRYSRQSDIVVGTAVAGRGLTEITSLIGCFINMLALRTDLSGKLTWQDVLQRVRKVCLDAYQHQDVPFEQIVEALRPQRDLSYTPLFQVMFVQQQEAWSQITLPGITIHEREVDTGIATFDLTFLMADSGQGILEYNTDLFDEQMIQRMVAHWYRLLESLITRPQQCIDEVPLLTTHEREQVLVEWNATQAVSPQDHCVHHLFEEQVQRAPEAVALVFEEHYLTYAALDERANQLAHILRAQGVGPEVLVGLALERSLEAFIALLAILKAGGAFVPLDPTLPTERLAFLLQDSCLSLLLSHTRLSVAFPSSQARLLSVDTLWPSLPQQSATPPRSLSRSEHLAYMIYTSGSTGRPKGVLIAHQGVCHSLLASIAFCDFHPADRLTQCASLSFDLCVLELFQALLAGATLCIIPTALVSSGLELAAFLRRQAITMMGLPPSLLQAVPADDLPVMHTVLVGGERCPAQTRARWAAGRRFLNGYGPTETSIQATLHTHTAEDRSGALIGRPLPPAQIYLLDSDRQPVPIGVPGEVYIGGPGLARGYLHRPDLTAEHFVPHPFSALPGQRLYQTGDLARYLPDGTLDFVGRKDQQVKLRGLRIELGEIEAALRQHTEVRDATVLIREDEQGEKQLVAYAVAKRPAHTPDITEIRQHLQKWLTLAMIPTAFVWLDRLPLTVNAKIDQQALLALPVQYPAKRRLMPPSNELERMLAQLWQEHLRIPDVDVNTNFFELGGHSLLMAKIRDVLRENFQRDVSMVDMFKYNTIATLARFLAQEDTRKRSATTRGTEAKSAVQPQVTSSEIAIIGLACRFPGARNAEEFWQNIREGRESISLFSDEELLAGGLDMATLQDPTYVKAGGILEDIELFDAGFFGYSPRDAEILDPQQRMFLECAEEALENAGYASRTDDDTIGVYASSAISTYFLYNIAAHKNPRSTMDLFQELTANDKDFLATRVSYKLNLKGPSLAVQTACSTSLVAVHLACQSLLNDECTIALAGAAAVRVPQKLGYHYQQGSIASPDGHCRAFDEQAQGTVFGNGVGIVILKRLDRALADKDTIYAVIKGTAINNDGATKVGYTAPSVQGQAQVIREAQARAGVKAESISYIEAHGTGTPMGDPIEVAALVEAFDTEQQQFCALGSVKTNVGHLDVASGMAGLIKTVYALKYRTLPPTLHFHNPNPALDLANSPFYIPTTAAPWESAAQPRRAGVSSFGIGGTNAHIILEEAPVLEQATPPSSWPWQVLVLSAKSEAALHQARKRLAAHLQQHPTVALADVAHTLQLGRCVFNHRLAVVCQDATDAVQVLENADSSRLMGAVENTTERPVVFLFPGQGAQHPHMGHGLYRYASVFRAEIDRCAELLMPYLELDLRTILFPDNATTEQAKQQLNQTWLTQPALFVVEYALAKQWQAWGIQPAALIGHSIGEYVAACLAEVFSLEDALWLVTMRGRLMQQMPSGAMLAVPLSEQQVQPLLGKHLCVAAVNAPNQCVIAGETAEVEALAHQLHMQGIDCRRLHTSHAFHSHMVDPLLPIFAEQVRNVQFHPPVLPYISSVTGTWITTEQATDPSYWVQQLRQTVRFADGVQELLHEQNSVLLEVGPGHTLSTFVRLQLANNKQQMILPAVISSLPQAREATSDVPFLLASLGRLWLSGVHVEWSKLYDQEQCRRVPLPTYPFERQRYWIEPLHSAYTSQTPSSLSAATSDVRSEINQQPGITLRPGEDMDQRDQSPSYFRPNISTPYVAPRSQMEQTVAGTWQSLLGIRTIGIHDNFFELGGHSLLATQIISHLRTTLQVEIPLRDVLEAATIAELADRIESIISARGTQQAPYIVAAPRDGDLPLSFAQQRLWFLNQLEPESAFYNMPGALSLQGPLSVETLRRSWQEVIQRHEVLRTTFGISGREVAQRILPSWPEEEIFSQIDLSQWSESEQEQEVQRWTKQEAQQIFDLTRGPLVRLRVLKLGAESHIVLVTMHHIISDGWSMGVFLKELTTLYAAFSEGKPSPLPPLALQYADFAIWQREWLQGERLETLLAYWKQQLAGMPEVIELPLDHRRPAVQSYRGARQSTPFPTTLTKSLRELSQREGVTLFMTLLTAFLGLLWRYSSQEDIVVGTPIANRNHLELEGLIGFFANTLVLRTSLAGDPTFRALLGRVREVTLDAYSHQDMPFEKLVEVLKPERKTSYTPLIQVLFALPPTTFTQYEFTGLTLQSEPKDSETSIFDLMCEVIDDGQTLRGQFTYNKDLFEPETIQQLHSHWLGVLEHMVAELDQPIGGFPLVTQDELGQFFGQWKGMEDDDE